MSSFSLAFEKIDKVVFNTLGDDIVVTTKSGAKTTIKAEFSNTWEEEELSNRVDGELKWLEIKMEDSHLFKRGTLVSFNDKNYEFFKDAPKDANSRMILLKDSKI